MCFPRLLIYFRCLVQVLNHFFYNKKGLYKIRKVKTYHKRINKEKVELRSEVTYSEPKWMHFSVKGETGNYSANPIHLTILFSIIKKNY